jgi:hypothetical protein
LEDTIALEKAEAVIEAAPGLQVSTDQCLKRTAIQKEDVVGGQTLRNWWQQHHQTMP